MSFARVFSVTAWQKNIKTRRKGLKTRTIDFCSRSVKMQERIYHLRYKEFINTISMEVTGGCKLPSVVPILQL